MKRIFKSISVALALALLAILNNFLGVARGESGNEKQKRSLSQLRPSQVTVYRRDLSKKDLIVDVLVHNDTNEKLLILEDLPDITYFVPGHEDDEQMPGMGVSKFNSWPVRLQLLEANYGLAELGGDCGVIKVRFPVEFFGVVNAIKKQKPAVRYDIVFEVTAKTMPVGQTEFVETKFRGVIKFKFSKAK